MSAIQHFGSQVWTKLVAWARAFNAALAIPAPLETDGFGRHDDGAVFQRRDY